MPRYEGHLWFSNQSTVTMKCIVTDDNGEDEARTDDPGGNGTINFTVYDGGDPIPRDYRHHVRVINMDNGQVVHSKDYSFRLRQAWSTGLAASGSPPFRFDEVTFPLTKSEAEGLAETINSKIGAAAARILRELQKSG